MKENIFENVKKEKPLIHCITNYVTVNDVANIILAAGASPIMADDSKEVEEITSICTSLLINMGTLNKRTVESMILAGKYANKLNHPVVLDPVGVGASSFRVETVEKLLKEVKFSVIRGNISEIKAVFNGTGAVMGVDASEADALTKENLEAVIAMARTLAKQTHAVIVISGAVDLVVGKEHGYLVSNGHPMMSQITGTGCMLNGVIASFIGANQDCVLDATTMAVSIMGYCGEMAASRAEGTSSFRMHLIDAMSQMTKEAFEKGCKIESIF
ncbi:MAG: hydroxyethylthiazole kinase [Anaerostipes sp.]|nr:hydroxyethylthiazole kinase [Anaerostipes sp.]